ncbi:hypothetical protein ACHAP5_003215 [Fusarium lateritium]
MHSTVFISLAVGLLGLDSVVASPCKPGSLATTATAETKTSELSSSLLSDTTASTELPETTATTTIAISESSLLSTDIESTISVALSQTSGLSSEPTLKPTVTSIEDSSSQATSDATSSAAETSTAALPISTLFSLIPRGGPADSEKLFTTGQSSSTLAAGVSGGQWLEAQFTYDEATGHILIGTQAMCVYYYNDNRGSMAICPTYNSVQFAPLVCEPPTGRYLKCSVPAVKCVTGSSMPVCTRSDAVFKTFYSGLWFGTAYQVFLSEVDRDVTNLFDPIDLVVNAL